jgi:hypothetical protein
MRYLARRAITHARATLALAGLITLALATQMSLAQEGSGRDPYTDVSALLLRPPNNGESSSVAGQISTVGQTGQNNQAGVSTTGTSNSTLQLQIGVGNASTLDISGTNNTLGTNQIGNHNSASISVVGQGNTIAESQIGNNLSIGFQQVGNGKSVTIQQIGQGK